MLNYDQLYSAHPLFLSFLNNFCFFLSIYSLSLFINFVYFSFKFSTYRLLFNVQYNPRFILMYFRSSSVLFSLSAIQHYIVILVLFKYYNLVSKVSIYVIIHTIIVQLMILVNCWAWIWKSYMLISHHNRTAFLAFADLF